MEPRKKCKRCGAAVHLYKAITGGKRYGSCGCDVRTWILDGAGIRFVEHTAPQFHSRDCSCPYKHGKAA